VLEKPWTADGRTFSDCIWNNKTELLNNLQTMLTQSLILGKPAHQSAKELSAKMGTKLYNAQRILHTEAAYFASEGNIASYKEADVEKYEILAVLDTLTSEICREMGGRVFETAIYKTGITVSPFYPNCRTTTVPYFEGLYIVGARIARGADGETFYVPASMKYKEWAETFLQKDLKKDIESSIIIIETALFIRII
jgi:SPP1 gp7 family putative phage head morphogenesis protein